LGFGSWNLIKLFYRKAKVLVIQLSIDYTKSGQYHFELAQKLSAFRTKGILIVGSGNIVHNLGLVDYRNFDKDNYGCDWAIEFRSTINNYLLEGTDSRRLILRNKLKRLNWRFLCRNIIHL
jgi:4,5-DOPA dioxygenase extradiol